MNFSGPMISDGCLILKEDELLPTIVSCKTFAWGCPSSVFNSSELYKCECFIHWLFLKIDSTIENSVKDMSL